MTRATESAAGVTRAYVGLGANLGDARRTVLEAWQALAALPHCRPLACSSLYRSAPVDAGGPDYVNAVASIATSLTALQLLDALLGIEARFGRERPYRNAPRTLDLDLLVFGEQVIAEPRLQVPHPRMGERAFVLRPLAELAPELMVPGRASVAELLAAVAGQDVERLG